MSALAAREIKPGPVRVTGPGFASFGGVVR
jgi:hypothetical protein